MKRNKTDHSLSGNPSVSEPACARVHPMDWAVAAGAVEEIWRDTKIKVRRRQRLRARATASVGALLVVIGLVWRYVAFTPETEDIALQNNFPASSLVSWPERRVLPDGSVLELKSGAEVRVAFTDALRRVVLLRGEAHFQVAKDPRKPFVVQVRGLDVRAVGTAFAVQLGAKEVEVLVTEGRVSVQETAVNAQPLPLGNQAVATGEPSGILVDAGKRVVVGFISSGQHAAASETVAISQTEIEERLAWRTSRLELTRTPLTEVIAAINQHSRVRITLADPELGNVRLSGILRADNADTLLRLLEEEHGLKSEQRGENEVVLKRE